jgi:hypothetical protein
MQRFPLLLIVSLCILLLVGFCKNNPANISTPIQFTNSIKSSIELTRLKKYGKEILHFAKQKNYSSKYAFLIDMKLPCGSKRFFVYDLKNDSVILSGLVTHGSGIDNTDSIIFSNKISSNCSSLGKYKIGASYTGKFGLAYKLYGLDSSNSNAYKRFVVLHSHACVPENEVQPQIICESWGCPTVAPSFLAQLQPYIDKAEKSILLQIFY